MKKIIIFAAVMLTVSFFIVGCDKNKDEETKYHFSSYAAYQDWVESHSWVVLCEIETPIEKSDTLSASLIIWKCDDDSPQNYQPSDFTFKVNGITFPLETTYDKSKGYYFWVNGLYILNTSTQVNFQLYQNEVCLLNKTLARPDFPDVTIHDNTTPENGFIVDKITWTVPTSPDYQMLEINTFLSVSEYPPFTENVMLNGKTRSYTRPADDPSYEWYFSSRISGYNVGEQNGNAVVLSAGDFEFIGFK